MTLSNVSPTGSSAPRSRRRWLIWVLWIVAAVAVGRALWLVPRQMAELENAGYFDRYEALSSEGTALLRGEVVEAWTGAAVGGVDVAITRLPSGEDLARPDVAWDPSAPMKVRAGDDGVFEANVAPGLYKLEVDSDEVESSPWTRAFVGRRAQLPASLKVVARPLCEATVEMVDAGGEPVVGAELFVRGGDVGRSYYGPRPPGMGITDDRGRASVRIWCGPATLRYVALAGEPQRFLERPLVLRPDAPALTLTLDEVKAAPLEPTDPSTRVDRRASRLDTLQLPPAPPLPDPELWGRVTAKAVDPAGEPVDAVMLLLPLDDPGFPLHRSHRFTRGTGFSQDGGRLTLYEVPPGRFRVVMIPVDQPIRTADEFALELGEQRDLGTLVVEPMPSSTLEGVVRGPDGPMGGAEVYAVATGELGRLFVKLAHVQWTPKTVTAPDGSYSLEQVPPGDVVVVAYHASVGVSIPTTVDADGATALNLYLVPGTEDRRTGWAHGALADLDERGLFVASVIHGSAAEATGILPGDRILYVDDTSVQWVERRRIYALLSGEERGLPETVTVVRSGEEQERIIQWQVGEGP